MFLQHKLLRELKLPQPLEHQDDARDEAGSRPGHRPDQYLTRFSVELPAPALDLHNPLHMPVARPNQVELLG